MLKNMQTVALVRFAILVLILIILTSLFLRHVFVAPTKWQSVNAQVMVANMKNALQQMYWQWQSEGRPEVLQYIPNAENGLLPFTGSDEQVFGQSKSSYKLNMNTRGLPIIEASESGCRKLLPWLVDIDVGSTLFKVKVATVDKVGEVPNGLQHDFACVFQYDRLSFRYNVNSGNLTMTTLE